MLGARCIISSMIISHTRVPDASQLISAMIISQTQVLGAPRIISSMIISHTQVAGASQLISAMIISHTHRCLVHDASLAQWLCHTQVLGSDTDDDVTFSIYLLSCCSDVSILVFMVRFVWHTAVVTCFSSGHPLLPLWNVCVNWQLNQASVTVCVWCRWDWTKRVWLCVCDVDNWTKRVWLCVPCRWDWWNVVRRKLTSWRSSWMVARSRRRWTGHGNTWRSLCLSVTSSSRMRWSMWLAWRRAKDSKVSQLVTCQQYCVLCRCLSWLHSADEDISWLTNYGLWHAHEKKKWQLTPWYQEMVWWDVLTKILTISSCGFGINPFTFWTDSLVRLVPFFFSYACHLP